MKELGRDRGKEAKLDIGKLAAWLGLFLLLGLEFWYHRRVKFMMDDLWYSTNLATGKPLGGLWDVIESQIWHFHHWGGRNITHGILQLVLLAGEWSADLLNLIMTLFLGWMICRIAKAGDIRWFLAAQCLLIALNANAKMSMFWQAGAVNYVYSTAWLLLFLRVYLRQLEEPQAKPLRGIAVWILPLGLAAGWSNENMGPACTLAAAGITAYLCLVKKCRLRTWMAEGVCLAGIGSALVILAPGNFVRVDAIEKLGFPQNLFQRMDDMFCATMEYLFPTFAITAAVILIYLCFCGGGLEAVHLVLLVTALAAHGAMALSPHYPDRATFGIMALCITVVVSLLQKMWEQGEKGRKWVALSIAACLVYAVFVLSQYLVFTDLIIGE